MKMKSEGRSPEPERNPKPEARSPKEVRRPKAEGSIGKTVLSVGYQQHLPRISDFGFRPSFGLRVSGFGLHASRLRPSDLGFRGGAAFTLIELLIVIAIIAILAAMIIPISGAVSRQKIRAKARTELEQVATAIELYKAKLGHYPPDNPTQPTTNQLYFELFGTILTNGTYVTLDGSAQIGVGSLATVFGAVGGFMNTSKGTSSDEGRSASSFLRALKPDETFVVKNSGGDNVKILVAGVPAPANYINSMVYISSNPTNNPNSYDLWVDIVISGKTNRLSNWTKQIVQLP